jgi:hypothetical protein
MNLVNHTPSTVFWSVTSSAQGDCGTLAPNAKTYLPVTAGPTYSVTFTAQDPKFFQLTATAEQTVTIAVTATSVAAGS